MRSPSPDKRPYCLVTTQQWQSLLCQVSTVYPSICTQRRTSSPTNYQISIPGSIKSQVSSDKHRRRRSPPPTPSTVALWRWWAAACSLFCRRQRRPLMVKPEKNNQAKQATLTQGNDDDALEKLVLSWGRNQIRSRKPLLPLSPIFTQTYKKSEI